MPRLVRGIHVFLGGKRKTWMRGTSPRMTARESLGQREAQPDSSSRTAVGQAPGDDDRGRVKRCMPRPRSAALELRDEEDLRAGFHGLVVADVLVDLAVDGDGGLVLEVVAEPVIETVELFEDAAEVLGLDRELLDALRVAPAQAAREHHARGCHHRVTPSDQAPPAPSAATSAAP